MQSSKVIPLRSICHVQVKLLKDAEQQGEERAKPKRPRAIVLGPTRELTDQILGVAKSMSHFAKFRSACVNGGQHFPGPLHRKACSLSVGRHCDSSCHGRAPHARSDLSCAMYPRMG